MLTISLNDLRFEAFHGIHSEERVLGNNYIVNCSVQIESPQGIIRSIDDTVNYQSLFELIKDQMQIPTPLLETVCMRIGTLIHDTYPIVVSVSLSIKKQSPPISGFEGSTSVSWNKSYQ